MYIANGEQDWLPFFGKLKNVTTVRKIWGEFRHQSICTSVYFGLSVNLGNY